MVTGGSGVLRYGMEKKMTVLHPIETLIVAFSAQRAQRRAIPATSYLSNSHDERSHCL